MAPKKKRQRRQRGAGSIYQTKDGSWIAQERIGDRLVRRRATSEPAAKAKLAELQELKRARIDIHSGEQSLAQWMSAVYAQKLRQRDLAERSKEFNRDMIERYINPALGQSRLIDIRPGHLQDLLDQLRADIRASTVHDGARTVHAVAALLKEALTLAFERKLILDNPYSGIVLPKLRRKKIEPVGDAELAAFLRVASSHRLAVLWWTYALLGLRRGEGLGLRWMGFDTVAGTILIDQQIQRVDGGRLIICPPKTDDSERTLPLPRRLWALYMPLWDTQQGERNQHADKQRRNPHIEPWKEHGLIFPSEVGTPLWPDNLEAQFRKLRAAAELPATVKLHHLRHTLSTLLDECGASESLKAGILGHAKATQTQKYTHARLAAMRAVLQAVEDRLFAAIEHAQTGT